ncbi:DUF222 domain-containing protein [Isoptericola sp. NPDC056573]|uniref:HNH endonuclease signature motif containing protein n=1 Tax=Isoptericola sp. NPDC056573 TaxID=3345868 RepID=UPI0036BD526B
MPATTAPAPVPAVPALPRATPASRLLDALATLEGGLAALAAAVEEAGLHDVGRDVLEQASGRLRTLGTRVDAARWRVLPALESDGRWSLDGSRTFAHWLARAENVGLATARRDVRTAHALRDVLPATGAAALDGRLGADHLRAIVDVAPTSEARRDALVAPAPTASETDGETTDGENPEAPDAALAPPTGEEHLLATGSWYTPAQFRRLVRRFAYVTDPESDERGYAHAREKEFVDLSPTWDGYHLAGFLTEEHGQVLRAALDAVSGRPGAGETRTPAQRRAQALADLARVTLDTGSVGSGSAVRPHLTVTVSVTELRRLLSSDGAIDVGSSTTSWAESLGVDPAEFVDGRGPLPPSLLRRIVCDSEVTRVVLGPESQVLDVGRARRTVTGQLRRAVVARDRRCTWPGCDEPPSRCEVHHAVTHWADGGSTSVDNSALLCWHHHDRVDALGITMRRTGGTWLFTDRHGRSAFGTAPPPAAAASNPRQPEAPAARAPAAREPVTRIPVARDPVAVATLSDGDRGRG